MDNRHDLVPPGEPNLLTSWFCGYIDLLRQHNHLPIDVFLWEYIQGWCWLGVGK